MAVARWQSPVGSNPQGGGSWQWAVASWKKSVMATSF